jgi:hypothetical protein
MIATVAAVYIIGAAIAFRIAMLSVRDEVLSIWNRLRVCTLFALGWPLFLVVVMMLGGTEER